jgi:hypothetical protein
MLAAIVAVAGMAFTAAPGAAQTMAEGEDVEFTAQVVDLSCKIVFDLSGDEHRMCAQVCADNGIPLGLLGEDGDFYIPVSSGMPGQGANERLRGHAEHTVQVRGKVIERGGMKSIIIESLTMQ